MLRTVGYLASIGISGAAYSWFMWFCEVTRSRLTVIQAAACAHQISTKGMMFGSSTFKSIVNAMSTPTFLYQPRSYEACSPPGKAKPPGKTMPW